ncbi:M23 family metallopeptidase [Alteromonas sp. K632G]|jgi:murein DD-endopeptidase MepM/ murein hydrolase activator NlpD|uniref:M23 family metallopeptidase n=1 Tax=Alteromonas sp. K632G TaxID=2820757 RepID=UPI001AD766E9|nr:M23 family metallopeptidase [Alteromonas sp. K632G]MBO7922408.1 M23 family metallopeptidase [Alteromonas sp. K632G]
MSSRVKGVKGAKSIQSIVINSLKVAARSAGFSALLLISGSLTAVHAQQDGITLNGTLTQGSLIRGQVAPDAIVTLDGETLALNSEGKFVFGFPRDASLSHTLNVELPDGTTLVRDITLTKREYNIQRIDGLDSKMVTPPKAVLERIRQDNVNVSIARSKVTDADALFTRFEWPAKGPITGVYGSQRVLNGVPKWPHFGVDVGGPTGAPVTAPVEGTVTLAEDLYYSGNTLILDHGMGVFSTFLHLDSITVKVGDTVAQGEQIGTIGATGRATGPHLDWRINLGKMRLDPQTVVSGTPE